MAKQKPLFCKHLENISGDVLSRYRNVIRDYVKGQHGVYALYQKNRLQLKGISSPGNFSTRKTYGRGFVGRFLTSIALSLREFSDWTHPNKLKSLTAK